MKYYVKKKFFGKYYVVDESGNKLFYLKRNFPAFWRFSFRDSGGKEVFLVKRKPSLVFAYELWKEDKRYAEIIEEPSFAMVFQTIKEVAGKEFGGLTVAKIRKTDGTEIEVKGKTMFFGEGFKRNLRYDLDFVKGKNIIARALKVVGLKAFTHIYEIEIVKGEENDLILLCLILGEIRSRGGGGNQSVSVRTGSGRGMSVSSGRRQGVSFSRKK